MVDRSNPGFQSGWTWWEDPMRNAASRNKIQNSASSDARIFTFRPVASRPGLKLEFELQQLALSILCERAIKLSLYGVRQTAAKSALSHTIDQASRGQLPRPKAHVSEVSQVHV